jgi:hypothetical protein
VSNSDAVPGQDPTNPVTFAFGMNYAFPRTIVSLDEHGHFTYTPTIDYGGNNGRSALLVPNGLYYAVGNANNGNATAFGPGNGTNPDVTETTGLEVVNPLNEFWPSRSIPAGNSAEVDPLLQSQGPRMARCIAASRTQSRSLGHRGKSGGVPGRHGAAGRGRRATLAESRAPKTDHGQRTCRKLAEHGGFAFDDTNVMWFEWKARASSQIFSRRADTRRPAAARSLWSQ